MVHKVFINCGWCALESLSCLVRSEAVDSVGEKDTNTIIDTDGRVKNTMFPPCTQERPLLYNARKPCSTSIRTVCDSPSSQTDHASLQWRRRCTRAGKSQPLRLGFVSSQGERNLAPRCHGHVRGIEILLVDLCRWLECIEEFHSDDAKEAFSLLPSPSTSPSTSSSSSSVSSSSDSSCSFSSTVPSAIP